jgi:hypothetical protein
MAVAGGGIVALFLMSALVFSVRKSRNRQVELRQMANDKAHVPIMSEVVLSEVEMPIHSK